MSGTANQKLKLLYLMKILLEQTDDEHTMTVNDMISELSVYGISAERKSIYDDIEALRHYGLDILMKKSKTYDYYIANRHFELPELKLLVDIVQSSKFITYKKSTELIKKIESLTSVYQARKLQRQVFVTNRAKTINERIYLNVDCLHNAISEDCQISFKYLEFTVDNINRYRNSGKEYIVSPYALSWANENYYLISHYPKYQGLTHFRVDRMVDIVLLDKTRKLLKEVIGENGLDIAAYSKKVFSMFGGEEEIVNLRFDISLVNPVIDRFGPDIKMTKAGECYFDVRLNVAISQTFFAWLFQFGDKVKILSPEGVVVKYKENLLKCLENHTHI